MNDNFIFIDVETGGLNPETDALLEIGAVLTYTSAFEIYISAPVLARNAPTILALGYGKQNF